MTYHIAGVSVDFPASKHPFPMQFALMGKVLQALKHKQHALLESPTGTGKTLALLCSTLAWQRHYAAEESLPSHATLEYEGVAGPEALRPQRATGKRGKRKLKVPTIFFASRTHSQIAQVVGELSRCPEVVRRSPDGANSLRTTVLGSRAQFCINKSALKKRNTTGLNEECKSLVATSKCRFYKGQFGLRRHTDESGLWDVEDLVEWGKKHRGCPYYVSRETATTAHIIFCPYNYLLDPAIRKSLDLAKLLKGAVVVIDEGHNVEEVAREAASWSVELQALGEATEAANALEQDGDPQLRDAHRKLQHLLSQLLAMLRMQITSLSNEADGSNSRWGKYDACKWGGHEALLLFKQYVNIDANALVSLREALSAINAAVDKDVEGLDNVPVLPPSARGLCDGLLTSLEFMLSENSRYARDFRMVMRRNNPHSYTGTGGRGGNKRRRRDGGSDQWKYTFSLWCLNPAVAFRGLSEMVRSIILTSGTLSPLQTFAAQLGVDFRYELEARHVVDVKRQLWIGSVTTAAKGVDFSAIYRNTDKFEYQDSLGNVLLQHIKMVPGGALCFFPSYGTLHKCSRRWKSTGLWSKLELAKGCVLIEPRGSEGFDKIFSQFRTAVTEGCRDIAHIAQEDTMESDHGQQLARTQCHKDGSNTKGALFLCVFRGKLSEGIDFSDMYARAVFVVGIPFPSWADPQVQYMKEHCDERCREKRNQCNASESHSKRHKVCLTGDAWYAQQAFRALNQALGRCIRHKDDYGAIVLLDRRFGEPSVTRKLSKWMRGSVVHYSCSSESVAALGQFFKKLGKLTSSAGPISNKDTSVDAATKIKIENIRASAMSTPSTLNFSSHVEVSNKNVNVGSIGDSDENSHDAGEQTNNLFLYFRKNVTVDKNLGSTSEAKKACPPFLNCRAKRSMRVCWGGINLIIC